MSHKITVLSALPDARILPSGLNATLVATLVCSFNFFLIYPVTEFHNITDLSAPAEATILSSGLNATL